MPKYTFPALLLSIFLCSACAPFAPTHSLQPNIPLDKPYSIQVEGQESDTLWWKNFNSAELNALIEKALSDNFTINVAYARLKQASANLKRAGADQYPTLDLTGGAKAGRTGSKAGTGKPSKYDDTQQYQLGAAAAYELDLWGRIKAQRSASEQQFYATQADLDAAAVTVAASVAETWVDLLRVRQEIAILNEQIENNKKRLEFQELRFINGIAESVDVLQQRQILASSQSELPLLIAKEQVLLNALSVLIGSTPLERPTIIQKELPELIALPTTGLPSDLLINRPDVRSSGFKLFSAEWSVAEARANRLPQFTLNANAAFQSSVAAVLFNNWVATLAGNVMQPLLDGGLRASEVERTRAVVEERTAQYSDTVSKAIQEVEDALVNEEQQQEYLRLISAQKDATAKTLEDAQLRYLQGQSGYLPLLQEVLNVQSLERQMILQQAELIKLRITLYRALGGGWTYSLAQVHDATPDDKNGGI
ncbi:efflux transporter outer membrane subunit [Halodesulfovibrio marinisediminis]|uniref:Efflux transporter, outer membrane factor (OMF) lipoprotein, NodT family n=1 Tax=Halodesulfovibrio marinisediminis DSM 17456 TaxID=1121457 RepID=A0A1N6FJ88_9BACT|nr:efflux transporter outer membrane subunit [Halodesulfovibrio marinisediminis]SIN95286.1 efflux transporter, outer membrane factor (OMF) lipoprotein, NodT family [Halodesulfovibrio marinisediminis DSM 17456]